MSFQSQLSDGFRTLRAIGYFAEENFWCCQTCGCASVPKKFAKKYVFYHEQDADRIPEEHSVYLAWDGQADEIRDVFQTLGLQVEHDGSKSTRIRVYE